MIIYRNTKSGFIRDTRNSEIANKIEESFMKNGLSHNNKAEFDAWRNSMQFMKNVLEDPGIDNDVNLAIEYQIPLTSKRVDFLLAGQDDNGKDNVVVVELKQWTDCTQTSREDIVIAFTGGANRAVCHPCYQAYSYAKTIETFNEYAYKNNVGIIPCAYLHNFREENRSHIDNEFYRNATSVASIFLEHDVCKLSDFIKSFVKKKGSDDILMKIDNGRLKPAKALQDSVASMLHGNKEFYLIDEQKVAYETVAKLVENSVKEKDNRKKVVIVSGGPGTGKSVIAIQLLCDLIRKGHSACYVTKNAAPRKVYFEKLKRDKYKMSYIRSLFKASDSFWNAPKDSLDCLIVDEAHRLRKKSATFYGENQIKELINASRVSVFFIDEDQKVTTKDIGSKDEIRYWANYHGAKIFEGDDLNLVSQFRCNGSDGYLNFLDNLLGLGETANTSFDNEYEFRVFDSPTELREELRKKNEISNKARMIAGYCYEWVSEGDPLGDSYDIVLEDGFKAKWNFENTLFAIDENSFDQVGCIHTTQGLEFDYCGIIIGQDLRYENGRVITDQTKEAVSDHSSGIRTCKDKAFADKLIRNTYKTLLSRGQKGCFIYCEDKKLSEYVKRVLEKNFKLNPQNTTV